MGVQGEPGETRERRSDGKDPWGKGVSEKAVSAKLDACPVQPPVSSYIPESREVP